MITTTMKLLRRVAAGGRLAGWAASALAQVNDLPGGPAVNPIAAHSAAVQRSSSRTPGDAPQTAGTSPGTSPSAAANPLAAPRSQSRTSNSRRSVSAGTPPSGITISEAVSKSRSSTR